MYVRLTQIFSMPEHRNDIRKIYYEDIVPVVRSQQGNRGAWLLESNENAGECISLTEWTSQKDAVEYEASGVYVNLVNMLKHLYTSKPVLKSYKVEGSKVSAAII
ncbi:MAG: antibiotic biosynthesis monooxygenase [Chitinophagaceae bacterium]|nr:antibiotic biosynthesis monooxygenase [Chitinophagaceae bacterium]